VEHPSFLPVAAAAAIVDTRDGWRASSCFSLFGTDVVVTLQLAAPPSPVVAQAFAAALVEQPSSVSRVFAFGLSTVGYGLGMQFDGWTIGAFGLAPLSLVGVVDGFDSGDAHPDGFLAFRLAAGVGLGVFRPQLRAAIHVGLGLERTPSYRDGKDHVGGSVLLDGRVIVGLGWLMVEGIARATRYYDIDCSSSLDRRGVCSDPSDYSDFSPSYGWDGELRVGITPTSEVVKLTRLGGFVSLRYYATRAPDSHVEHASLVGLGVIWW